MSVSLWKSPAWRIRTWGYLALAALLLLDAIPITLWYQALFEPPALSDALIFLILLGILAFSFCIASGMELLHWKMPLRQAVFAAWVLLIMFISLKGLLYTRDLLGPIQLIGLPMRFILHGDAGESAFFHLIVIGLLVWRGVSLANGPVTLNTVQSHFQTGLLFLLLYGMLFGPLHPSEATLGLYSFLFCGLVDMSAARIANLSELRGGRIPRFGAGWMFSILLASLLVVALAILVGQLISGRIAEAINLVILVVFAIGTGLTLIILSPLFLLLSKIIPAIIDLFDQLIKRLQNLGVLEQLQKAIESVSQVLEKFVPFLLAGRGLLLVLILSVLLVVILLALRLRALQRETIEETETGSAGGEETSGLLKKLLNRMLHDVRGLRRHSPAQLLAAARVRQIYRQLMALSHKLGHERPPSLTPLEFLPHLQQLFPEEELNVGVITQAYVQVRYGEYPETREEVQRVETAWENVRRKGRRLLSNLPKKQNRLK